MSQVRMRSANASLYVIRRMTRIARARGVNPARLCSARRALPGILMVLAATAVGRYCIIH